VRWKFLIVGAEILVLAGLALWLMRVEAAGPHRMVAKLARGRDALLYLPTAADAAANGPTRPPAVILVPGLGAGPSTVASLSRRLARNGYAALAIGIPLLDFASKGSAIHDDIAAAVDYTRRSKLVDGSRIVLIGHSAGAGAVSLFAAGDRSVAGAVMVSGGCNLDSAQRPPNALFVFTSEDPADFRTACRDLLARLSGAANPRLATTYGDFHAGTAVSEVETRGESHVSIIAAESTASYALGWLDRVFETQRRTPVDLADPQGHVADLVLVSILLLALTLYYFWLRGGRKRRGAPKG
jgi:dienelactone hydrolase